MKRKTKLAKSLFANDDSYTNFKINFLNQLLSLAKLRLIKSFSRSDFRGVSDAENEILMISNLDKEIRLSEIKSENASKERKAKPSKEVLVEYKGEYIYKRGVEHGWKSAACRKFGISYPTLNNILEK